MQHRHNAVRTSCTFVNKLKKRNQKYEEWKSPAKSHPIPQLTGILTAKAHFHALWDHQEATSWPLLKRREKSVGNSHPRGGCARQSQDPFSEPQCKLAPLKPFQCPWRDQVLWLCTCMGSKETAHAWGEKCGTPYFKQPLMVCGLTKNNNGWKHNLNLLFFLFFPLWVQIMLCSDQDISGDLVQRGSNFPVPGG